jgi:hypothetical protein
MGELTVFVLRPFALLELRQMKLTDATGVFKQTAYPSAALGMTSTTKQFI